MAADLKPGTRVTVAGHTYGDATFVGYGDPRLSCPATHVSHPGMRLAIVKFDRYGERAVWEKKLYGETL